MGLIIAVVVHAGNVQDRDGAKRVMARLLAAFPRPEPIWADGGWAGKLVEWVSAFARWTPEIVKRTGDLGGVKLLPHRWVVGRAPSGAEGSRGSGGAGGTARGYDHLTEGSEAAAKVSMIKLMLHRLSPG